MYIYMFIYVHFMYIHNLYIYICIYIYIFNMYIYMLFHAYIYTYVYIYIYASCGLSRRLSDIYDRYFGICNSRGITPPKRIGVSWSLGGIHMGQRIKSLTRIRADAHWTQGQLVGCSGGPQCVSDVQASCMFSDNECVCHTCVLGVTLYKATCSGISPPFGSDEQQQQQQ